MVCLCVRSKHSVKRQFYFFQKFKYKYIESLCIGNIYIIYIIYQMFIIFK